MIDAVGGAAVLMVAGAAVFAILAAIDGLLGLGIRFASWAELEHRRRMDRVRRYERRRQPITWREG